MPIHIPQLGNATPIKALQKLGDEHSERKMLTAVLPDIERPTHVSYENLFINRYHSDISVLKGKPYFYMLGDLSFSNMEFVGNDIKYPINVNLTKTYNNDAVYICVSPSTPKKEFLINKSDIGIVYIWTISNYIPEMKLQLDRFDWDYFIEAFPYESTGIIRFTHFNSNCELSNLFHDKLIEIDFLGKISDRMEKICYIDLDWMYLVENKYEPAYEFIRHYLNTIQLHEKESMETFIRDVKWKYFNNDKILIRDFDYFKDVLDIKNMKIFGEIIQEANNG